MRGPRFIVAIVLTTLLSIPVLAQRHRDNPPPHQNRDFHPFQQQQGQPRDNGNNNRNNNDANHAPRFQRPGPHIGDWLRRHEDLPPAEQQKQLEKDPNFQRSTPEQQQQMRQRLEKFNNLPPDQKQRVLNRMDMLEHMSPAQRQETRQLFQQFRQLNPDRREVVRSEIRRIRSLPPEERQRTYNSDQFRNNFSPDEQSVIRGMGEMPQPSSPGAQEPH